jgi:hypothetical protein
MARLLKKSFTFISIYKKLSFQMIISKYMVAPNGFKSNVGKYYIKQEATYESLLENN